MTQQNQSVLDAILGGGGQQPVKLPEGTRIVINGQPMPVRYQDGNIGVVTPGGGFVKLPGGAWEIEGVSGKFLIDTDGTILQKEQPATRPQLNLKQSPEGLWYIETTDESGNVSAQLAPEYLQKMLLGIDSGGGGGSWTGTLPDPGRAAQLLLDYYDRQIQASNGTFDAQMALANFQKDWEQYLLDWQTANLNVSSAWGLEKIRQEGEAKARQLGLYETEANIWRTQQQEATQRGGIISSQVLPRFVPGLESISLPFVGGGPIPVTKMKPSDVFAWGGGGIPGLAEPPKPAPGIGEPVPVGEPPQLPAPPPMPSLPSVPQYPAPPDIRSLIDMVASGIRVA